MKSYASDAPIKSQSEDRFRRYPFAKRIAETIIARPEPGSLVVGIYDFLLVGVPLRQSTPLIL